MNNRKIKLEEEFEKQTKEKKQFYISDEMLSHHSKYVMRSSVSVSANARSSVVDLQIEFVSSPSVSLEGPKENIDEKEDVDKGDESVDSVNEQ